MSPFFCCIPVDVIQRRSTSPAFTCIIIEGPSQSVDPQKHSRSCFGWTNASSDHAPINPSIERSISSPRTAKRFSWHLKFLPQVESSDHQIAKPEHSGSSHSPERRVKFWNWSTLLNVVFCIRHHFQSTVVAGCPCRHEEHTVVVIALCSWTCIACWRILFREYGWIVAQFFSDQHKKEFVSHYGSDAAMTDAPRHVTWK